MLITGAAAAALPLSGLLTVAWLLPALALTAAALALGRFIPLPWAAGALIAAWLVAAAVTADPFSGGLRFAVLTAGGSSSARWCSAFPRCSCCCRPRSAR